MDCFNILIRWMDGEKITIDELGELMLRGMIKWDHPSRKPILTERAYHLIKKAPNSTLTDTEWGLPLGELLDN